MTVIAATQTAIACDQLASNYIGGYNILTKIHVLDNGFVGVAGNAMIINYIEDHCPDTINSYEEVKAFWHKFRKWCKKHNYMAEHDMPSAALFLLEAGLFDCDTSGAVMKIEGYASIGSGMYSALGSLHSTIGKSDHKRVKMAVQAAIAHNPQCGGKPRVYEL